MKIIKKLPDPFRKRDGNRVCDVEDWQLRREEIKDMMLNIQYGTMPGPPDRMNIKKLEKNIIGEDEVIETIHFEFIPRQDRPDIKFGMDVTVLIPSKEAIKQKKKQIEDFGKDGLPCVIYVGGRALFDLSDEGYMVISYQNTQLEPDKMGNPIIGPAQSAYEDAYPEINHSWGSIAVWTWGGMRMVDYALTRKDVNPNQIIISGHSRNGKTALLAGALDERISIVNPAGSGCAGAGSYLILGDNCEDLAALTGRDRWWAWTHPDFEKWADREQDLPFDQHFLMGLVAPRPLIRVEGDSDEWANPKGTSCTFLATEPIYEFLSAKRRNGIFYHKGGHQHTDEDRQILMKFAEDYFFKGESGRKFKDIIIDPSLKSEFMDWQKP